MSNSKKENSVHIRYNDKVRQKFDEFKLENGNEYTQEASLLIIDGILARDLLSERAIKDNRRKYL